MPDESLLDEMYGPNYVERHYSAELRGGGTRQEMNRELQKTVDWLADHRPKATVLDVGCGAGQFLIAAQKAGLRPEGYERLAATAQIAAQVTAVRVHAGELEALEKKYDVIHLADVLEHSPTPLEFLLRLRQALAPNGLMVVRGPLEGQVNLFQRAMQFSRVIRGFLSGGLLPTLMPPYHLVLFTYAGWNALLNRSRMHLLHQEVYESHWPAPEQFELRLISLAKEMSLLLSRSRLGRHLRLGNRVISVLTH